MATDAQLKAIDALIDEFDGQLYENYSGRGMYGANCYGMTFDADQDDVSVRARELGLKGARFDSMGLGGIIYWPSIS